MIPGDLHDELEQADLAMRDAAYVARTAPALGRLMRLYFRSEVRGMDRVPVEGRALLVSNHSGGQLPMDVPILLAAFVEEFGPERPLYTLAPDLFFRGLAEPVMRRCGCMPATGDHAATILDADGVTIVFPGGEHERLRPSSAANTVDFAGSTGYVRTALDTGSPIVPVVSIGGQEGQLHLARGAGLARLLRLDSLLGRSYLPISLGLPFGLLPGLPNLPLPTKIVTQVLEAIHPDEITATFGKDPDVDEVDTEVRRRMQECLDDLARARRFPVIG